jgi:hypothetical protein
MAAVASAAAATPSYRAADDEPTKAFFAWCATNGIRMPKLAVYLQQVISKPVNDLPHVPLNGLSPWVPLNHHL